MKRDSIGLRLIFLSVEISCDWSIHVTGDRSIR